MSYICESTGSTISEHLNTLKYIYFTFSPKVSLCVHCYFPLGLRNTFPVLSEEDSEVILILFSLME